ncbi:unknown protein [Seminavis robusta]|uniref:Uncharacterized protein n=1 Tax=Seminavis robusta TaxID=568900 RepID=A0A9N8HW14_9STRA|nr:unknown protein [Seminavis robusta]|eukprot:Sro2494_g329251.1  (143) ;mRNA; f:1956-2384
MDQNNTPMIHYLLIFLGVEPRTVRLMRDVFGVVDINHLGLFLCEFFNESPHGINASNYEVSVDAIFEGDYWLVKKLVYFFLHFTAFAATLEALNCSRGERALSFYLGNCMAPESMATLMLFSYTWSPSLTKTHSLMITRITR